ncbi:hypothetical protein Agabi119p4_10190 [Agaricus bisporus var. burnettii]|uniref:Uncharacterized protein n=1 Tax=Agaricus bisporus var. burnettii TaxID=192524 RepID=A0A8H7EW72_AGABI|nr:hypothetical protein Agabi119p4_10190 [Agaricus bisporus var. burnettii]
MRHLVLPRRALNPLPRVSGRFIGSPKNQSLSPFHYLSLSLLQLSVFIHRPSRHFVFMMSDAIYRDANLGGQNRLAEVERAPFPTLLDRNAGRRRVAWVQKLYDSYERAGEFIYSAKCGIAVCFEALKTAFYNAARCVCDATMRVVWPLAEAVRGLFHGRALFIAHVVLFD